MGLFSDKCPECGGTVRRTAKFCSSCGKTGPKSWFKCGGCGKWVGGESKFCWSCHTELHPELRGLAAGGVWQRPAGAFAQRFDLTDLRDQLSKGITIQTGTMAVLLDSGVFKDVLPPGKHTLDSLLHRLTHWGSPPPRTVILVEAGDVVLPLRIEGLRTSEELPVEFYGEVAFRFDPAQAEAFVTNLLKGDITVTYATLSAMLEGEIRYAAENLCNSSSMEDLIRDPVRRLRLENTLREVLNTALARLGLTLVRVASAEFAGAEYEKLRQKMGDVELKRREVEFDQRLREILSGDNMHQFKTEHDLDEFVAQLAQEKAVSGEHREHELGVLRQVHRHELEAKEASFQIGQEMQQTEHQISMKVKWDDYEGDRTLKSEHVQDQVADIRRAREGKDVEQALDWRRKKQELDLRNEAERKRLEREDLEGRGRIYQGMNMEAMLATIDDPARRAHLLELFRQTQSAGKSVQEILALQAATSPASAEALKEMLSRSRTELAAEFTDRKKLSDDGVARLEAILKTAMESMATAAKQGGVNVVR